MLAAALIGAALAAPAYSQTAGSSALSAQGETPELRVAASIAPPSVMEQNGTLTGFSVDLWNAIAARLKVKTSYQIVPDVSHLEEAMRSKNADLTLGLFITSARDEVFDFSIPTLQAGLQVMVRDTGETAQTASPVWDMLRLLFSRTTVVWLGIALVLVLIPAHLVWLFERRRQDGIISSPDYFPGIFDFFLGDFDADGITGGDAASMGGAHVLNLLDICRCGFRCVLHRPANDHLDRRADSRLYRGAGRLAG